LKAALHRTDLRSVIVDFAAIVHDAIKDRFDMDVYNEVLEDEEQARLELGRRLERVPNLMIRRT
jgi:hypothetical protein